MLFRDKTLSDHMPEGLLLILDSVFRPSCMRMVGNSFHLPSFPGVRHRWIVSSGYGVDMQQ